MTRTLFTILPIVYSILMLWHVSTRMRESKLLLPYLPFFFWGILINTLGAFVFYDMFFTFSWFLLDGAFFLCYVLLLITLVYVIRNTR